MKPIFLFHQVAHVPIRNNPLGLVTSPEKFSQEMAYLYNSGFNCLSLNEMVINWGKDSFLPNKCFAITFDDGFQDIYTTAWPILARYGFTATIFLVGDYVFRDRYRQQQGTSEESFLSWEEVRELARSGFTFGSHSLTHKRLTSLDDEQALREISESKVLIEEKIGIRVNLFSYPYGNSDARIQRMVAENGYIAACGVDRGTWGFYNLWRAQSNSSDGLLSVRWKAHGGHYWTFRLREHSALGPPLRRLIRIFKRGLHHTKSQDEVEINDRVPF